MSIHSDDVYVVYLYCDYRKEVDIQHLKVFKCRDDAINFAKKYSGETVSRSEYVSIKGSEYDAALYYPSEEEDDEKYFVSLEKYEKMKKELGIKKGMWHIRIAVDIVKLVI
jgi:hypothetical protein